jgi:hypothetical protein
MVNLCTDAAAIQQSLLFADVHVSWNVRAARMCSINQQKSTVVDDCCPVVHYMVQ